MIAWLPTRRRGISAFVWAGTVGLHRRRDLDALIDAYVKENVAALKSRLLPAAIDVLHRHREQGDTVLIAVERLVCRFAHLLFPGFEVLGDGVFRVLRDSDLEIEEEAEDLVRLFRSAIQRRRRGQVIMLELDHALSLIHI